MVYFLIHKEVGDPIYLSVYVAHLLLQASNDGCRCAGGVLLVFVRESQHLSRPRLWHNVLREQFGKVGDENFFSDIRLRTASRRFFGTAIIGVAFLFLGGDHASALAAPEQAAKGLRFFVGLLRMSPPLNHGLHFVEQRFADEWRMPAFIYLATIAEMAIVKWIGEDEFYLVFMERVAVQTFHAVLKKESRNVLKAGVAF